MTSPGKANDQTPTEAADAPGAFRVLLISMPFGPLLEPSLGLSLLRAAVSSQAAQVRILYCTLAFANRIGPELYLKIANGEPSTCHLLGEWLFADAVFPEYEAPGSYVSAILRAGEVDRGMLATELPRLDDDSIDKLLAVRGEVPGFLADCVRRVCSFGSNLVGFTSVFQQNLASIALARALKLTVPDITVIFGGANCEGVMGRGLVDAFPWIDAAVSGEGEIVFPQIVARARAGEPLAGLPGVHTRATTPPRGSRGTTIAPGVAALDDLPVPDFSDFFSQFAEAGFPDGISPRLLFETSRGCWWGEKHHCTFCGLNGATMRFRSKSAERASTELRSLVRQHPNLPVSVVDNIIDYRYFRDFIPQLAASELDVDLFYEVKANLRKTQLEELRDAGIRRLQPGIESLSDHVLKLMNKGVRSLQNIQLLKWCKELGLEVHWNLLWGFPGELADDYATMARIIRHLSHLPPPSSASGIRLDRFSPLFERADEYGLCNVQPVPAYDYIYALPKETVTRLAYFFTFDYVDEQAVAEYTEDVAVEIKRWQEAYRTLGSDLFYVITGERALVFDLRPHAPHLLTILRGLGRDVFCAIDSYETVDAVSAALEQRFDGTSLGEVPAWLDLLAARGLAATDGRAFVSLPVKLGRYAPTAQTSVRLHELLSRLGTEDEQQLVMSRDVVERATLRLGYITN